MAQSMILDSQEWIIGAILLRQARLNSSEKPDYDIKDEGKK
jgi:hypothetical protein